MQKKQKIIAIAGPTASGKTSLSIALAKIFSGEIISADSMQIYRGLDIATAKPTAEEMGGIPHHLMDFLDIDKNFSVAEYVKLARDMIQNVSNRGNLPFIVGGTGLYISSLVKNIQFDDNTSDLKVREKLYSLAKEHGNGYLVEKLRQIDEKTASELHENNLNRIVRAIEVYEVTGKTMSQCKIDSLKVESPYDCLYFVLMYKNRQTLYDKINLRVDLMVKNGLINEGKDVYLNGKLATAYQAIGYKELIPYYKNEASLEECLENLKMQTRRYAKRQITWFSKEDNIIPIYLDDFNKSDEIINFCKKTIENFVNI